MNSKDKTYKPAPANFSYFIGLIAIQIFSFATDIRAQQNLQKGFSKTEYTELMYISAHQLDTPWVNPTYPLPKNYQLSYRSEVCGLDNRWDLFTSVNLPAVISIRGTTKNGISWLENFYAAMTAATGRIKISNQYTFDYCMAENPRAAIHTGWLIATACLSRTIIPKIDSLFRAGQTQFYIVGHSQGGAIAYLLTAQLHYMQKQGKIPAQIRFKTYCSAAPKPGNLYFAYDYETYTQNGWAYNVVNADDWVPESPVAIQSNTDFNEINPFSDVKNSIRKQKLGIQIAMKAVYKNLVRPVSKARNKNIRYLGKKTAILIRKNLPEYVEPVYVQTSNYTRAGNYITLKGNAEYYTLFPNRKEKVFMHHMWDAYLYLIAHCFQE